MNKKHFLLYWMQNFSSFISYTGFLTPFKVKTWFFYSINARYYLWEENNNAKMSRSIKILDVPKTFQFSFFFTPVCVYFQKISMARNAIFFLFKCWILKQYTVNKNPFDFIYWLHRACSLHVYTSISMPLTLEIVCCLTETRMRSRMSRWRRH